MSTNQPVVTQRDWATKIIELYTAGASDVEVAAACNVTIQEYYRQLGDNAAFNKLVEFGRTLSQAFWESQARKNIGNKGFNTSLWAFYMKNKYSWADKTESVNSNENLNTDLDTLRGQITKEVARFVKDYTPEQTDAQRVLSNMAQDLTNA